MSSAPPIPMRWTGEAMEPLPGFRWMADQHFVIGQVYRMAEVTERSDASHRHEFAWLREAWANLPESLAEQFPTPEHLRKRALIDAGFYDEQIIDAGSGKAALRVAQGIRSRPGEDFSLVVVRGAFVVIRTAKSQSRRAMDKAEFQASKTAIMDTVAALIGVTTEQLSSAAQGAAHGGESHRARAA